MLFFWRGVVIRNIRRHDLRTKGGTCCFSNNMRNSGPEFGEIHPIKWIGFESTLDSFCNGNRLEMETGQVEEWSCFSRRQNSP